MVLSSYGLSSDCGAIGEIVRDGLSEHALRSIGSDARRGRKLRSELFEKGNEKMAP
jgi:hypothetical protein